MTDKLNLVYDRKHSFGDYRNIRIYDLSFMTRYDILSNFYHSLIEFRSLVPWTEQTKNNKECTKNATNL